MTKKRRYNSHTNTRRPPRPASAPAVDAPEKKPYEKKPEQLYGPPFVLLEDESKNTFEYRRGAWVAHERTIAECKIDCQVTQLAQKVNRMTRYEVRRPLP